MFDLKSDKNLKIYWWVVAGTAALMYVGSFSWGCVAADYEGEFWPFLAYFIGGSLITTLFVLSNMLLLQLLNNVNIIRQHAELISTPSAKKAKCPPVSSVEDTNTSDTSDTSNVTDAENKNNSESLNVQTIYNIKPVS